jgi:hypothetical protein
MLRERQRLGNYNKSLDTFRFCGVSVIRDADYAEYAADAVPHKVGQPIPALAQLLDIRADEHNQKGNSKRDRRDQDCHTTSPFQRSIHPRPWTGMKMG